MNLNKIVIIGIGLMGSSFALALRKGGFKGEIKGIGRKKSNLARAKKLGIIDSYSTDHSGRIIKDADLVLLSTPVGHFEEIVSSIRNNLKKGTIITDLGSVKARIVKRLDSMMPDGVNFVGAHPIAGKECSGIEGASADLFENARCIITPGKNTDRRALTEVRKIWKFAGARTLTMSPEEHDMIYAAVSHMPHVIAYALINSVSDLKKEMLPFSGRGFKDMTRIAMSPAELWRDICALNKKDILRTLRKFSSSISRMTRLIEKSDWSGLEKEFNRAIEARQLIEPVKRKI
jgi:prephenate dehydrogenase